MISGDSPVSSEVRPAPEQTISPPKVDVKPGATEPTESQAQQNPAANEPGTEWVPPHSSQGVPAAPSGTLQGTTQMSIQNRMAIELQVISPAISSSSDDQQTGPTVSASARDTGHGSSQDKIDTELNQLSQPQPTLVSPSSGRQIPMQVDGHINTPAEYDNFKKALLLITLDDQGQVEEDKREAVEQVITSSSISNQFGVITPAEAETLASMLVDAEDNPYIVKNSRYRKVIDQAQDQLAVEKRANPTITYYSDLRVDSPDRFRQEVNALIASDRLLNTPDKVTNNHLLSESNSVLMTAWEDNQLFDFQINYLKARKDQAIEDNETFQAVIMYSTQGATGSPAILRTRLTNAGLVENQDYRLIANPSSKAESWTRDFGLPLPGGIAEPRINYRAQSGASPVNTDVAEELALHQVTHYSYNLNVSFEGGDIIALPRIPGQSPRLMIGSTSINMTALLDENVYDTNSNSRNNLASQLFAMEALVKDFTKLGYQPTDIRFMGTNHTGQTVGNVIDEFKALPESSMAQLGFTLSQLHRLEINLANHKNDLWPLSINADPRNFYDSGALSFHIDMASHFTEQKDNNGRQVVLVGQEQNPTTFENARRQRQVAQLEAWGYSVKALPELKQLTYTNVMTETNQDGSKVIYVPTFSTAELITEPRYKAYFEKHYPGINEDYLQAMNQEALRIYQETYPNAKVVPISGGLIPGLNDGGLRCVTMELQYPRLSYTPPSEPLPLQQVLLPLVVK